MGPEPATTRSSVPWSQPGLIHLDNVLRPTNCTLVHKATAGHCQNRSRPTGCCLCYGMSAAWHVMACFRMSAALCKAPALFFENSHVCYPYPCYPNHANLQPSAQVGLCPGFIFQPLCMYGLPRVALKWHSFFGAKGEGGTFV